MMEIKGTYTALITPFNRDYTIDLEGWRHNIEWQIDQGIDGIVILGTTGETPTLTGEEQQILITEAVETANKAIPVIVGTGAYSTRQTIINTQQAQQLGADAALIVTPYYNKPTQEGIYLHFKAINDNTDLPIIIYNIPGRCGQNITTDTMAKLATLSNVISVKEASGDLLQINDVINIVANSITGFSVISGDDILTLPIMALGGQGVISVASNIIPCEISIMVQALLNDDIVQARNIHHQIMPLLKNLFIETNPIPIKTAMNLCNMPAGPCRLPLCDMAIENKRQLQVVLHNMNIVNVAVGALS